MSRQIIEDVFYGRKTERIPVSFWYHFCQTSEFPKGPGNEQLFRQTVEKHISYFKDQNLDLVKIMPDGYFTLPSLRGKDTGDVEVLKALEPSDPHDLWFEEQLQLVKQIKSAAGDDAAVFYTVFSPLSLIAYSQFQFEKPALSDHFLSGLFKKEADAISHALAVVTGDVENFAKRVLEEAGADGIFFAVRNYKEVDKDTYLRYIAPGEKQILESAARIKDLSILHICGGFGLTNDFSYYQDYRARAVNWSTGVEKLSLGKAKELFKDKAVIGGFDNTSKSILIHGTKEEIREETKRLIEEAGKDRLVIGADCALPTNEVIDEKLKWVREVADELSGKEILPRIRKS